MPTQADLQALREEERLAELEAKMGKRSALPSAVSQIPTSGYKGAEDSLPQSTIMGDALTGLKQFGTRASTGITDIAAMLGGDYLGRPLKAALQKYGLSPTDEQRASVQQQYDQAGPMATATNFGADVATGMAALPSKVPAVVNGLATASRSIPVLKQALQNALYNLTTAPQDEKSVGAVTGYVAPFAGKAAGTAAGGLLKNMVTPEAKLAQSHGISLTPGQSVSGADMGFGQQLIRKAEDAGRFFTGVGDVISYLRNKGGHSAVAGMANEALEPLATKVSTKLPTGKAVDAANELIQSEGYLKYLPGVHLDPDVPVKDFLLRKSNAPLPSSASYKAYLAAGKPFQPDPTSTTNNMEDALRDIGRHYAQNVGGFSNTGAKSHSETFMSHIERDIITNVLEKARDNGVHVEPQLWKGVYSKLGDLERKYANKTGDELLGEAFGTAKQAWLHGLEDTVPGSGASKGLLKADEAWSKMIPINDAMERVTQGSIKPNQMRVVVNALKRKPSELDKALRSVMPDAEGVFSTTNRLLAAGGLGGAGHYFGMDSHLPALALTSLGAGATVAGLSSKAGQKALQEGIHPAVLALRKAIKLKNPGYDKEALDRIISNITTQSARAGGDLATGD